MKYLSVIKWKDIFKCVKCDHVPFQVRKDFSRTCNICGHTESFPVNTLFQKVKFGLHKAFLICFEMMASTKSLSASQMGVRYGVTERTVCFSFSRFARRWSTAETSPWKGYLPITKAYDITQIESNNGLNSEALHTMIHQIKTGIRTTYLLVSDININSYFNQFCFGINRFHSKVTLIQ